MINKINNSFFNEIENLMKILEYKINIDKNSNEKYNISYKKINIYNLNINKYNSFPRIYIKINNINYIDYSYFIYCYKSLNIYIKMYYDKNYIPFIKKYKNKIEYKSIYNDYFKKYNDYKYYDKNTINKKNIENVKFIKKNTMDSMIYNKDNYELFILLNKIKRTNIIKQIINEYDIYYDRLILLQKIYFVMNYLQEKNISFDILQYFF